MTPQLRQLTLKRALETIEPLEGGICPGPLFDQVERIVGHRLTDLERSTLAAELERKQWVRSARHAFTDEIIYFITDAGRMAMIGL